MSERKVYIVTMDYGCDGLSKRPETFIVFEDEEAAKAFIDRADRCGGAVAKRILIPAEYVEY